MKNSKIISLVLFVGITTSFACFTSRAMDGESPKIGAPFSDDFDRKQQAHKSTCDFYKDWRIYTVLTFKGSRITSCAMSPDGSLLVHALKKGGVEFTTASNGKTITLEGNNTYSPTRVACSPKAPQVATGESLHTGGHRLRIYWGLDTLGKINGVKNIHEPMPDAIRSLCYTHDGHAIAIGLDDGSAHLRKLTDIDHVAKQFLLDKNQTLDSEPIEALACIDNNTFCCGLNKSLVLFDTRAEGAASRIPGHMSRISRVATSSMYPTLLASSAYDRTVKLWDLHKNTARWTGQDDAVTSALAMHPRYEHVIMGNKDGTMTIAGGRDAMGFAETYDAPISDIATTRDGDYIMSASSNGIYKIYGTTKSITALCERWKKADAEEGVGAGAGEGMKNIKKRKRQQPTQPSADDD